MNETYSKQYESFVKKHINNGNTIKMSLTVAANSFCDANLSKTTLAEGCLPRASNEHTSLCMNISRIFGQNAIIAFLFSLGNFQFSQNLR